MPVLAPPAGAHGSCARGARLAAPRPRPRPLNLTLTTKARHPRGGGGCGSCGGYRKVVRAGLCR